MSELATPEMLLNACPVCGYALEGLPVEHRCPECGFALDRRMWAFGELLPVWLRVTQAIVVIALAMAVNTFISIRIRSAFLAELVEFLIQMVALWYVFFGVFNVAGASNWRYGGRWIAVGPFGVRRYRDGAMLREIRWDAIQGSRYTRGRGFRLINSAGFEIEFGRPGETIRPADSVGIVRAISTYPYKEAAAGSAGAGARGDE